MLGTAIRTRRPFPARVNHANESHHSFILMTQDVAVKDELARERPVRCACSCASTRTSPAVIETPVYDTFLTPEQVKAVLPTFNAFHPLGGSNGITPPSTAVGSTWPNP